MAKILLVEDDDNLREIYEARLLAEGYEIVTARNGEDALVVAKENKPDLIISDVMMPNISGFDMLDILRNTQGLHDAKVIMLTALSQADDKIRAEKLGADRYLVKSQVTLEDIVNTAAELLGITHVEPTPAPAVTAPVPELSLTPPIDPTSNQNSELPVSPSIAAPAVSAATEPANYQQPQAAFSEPTQTQPVTPAPLFDTPVAGAPVNDTANVASAPAPSSQNLTVPQPTPSAPPVVAGPIPEPTVVAAPIAVPSADPVAPSAPMAAIPVVEPPALEEDSTDSVISMPSQETTQQPSTAEDAFSVATPVSAPTPEVVVSPIIDQQNAVATEQAPAQQSTTEMAAEQLVAPEFDPANAQSMTSEGAVIQQQIDSFVSNAPIVTPEFNPTSFGATNENGEVESTESTVPRAVPPAEQLTAEHLENESAAEQPVVAAPSDPSQPTVFSPSAPVAAQPAAQQVPADTTTEQSHPVPAAAPESMPHAPTGGNKVIQPLASTPEEAAAPSLNDLLAKEEANSSPSQQVIQPLPPAQPVQQPVQAPAQPPATTQPPQTTVFDPDDPSSVSL